MAKITEATRRDIRDLFIAEKIRWSGRLEEADFLRRLYDLDEFDWTFSDQDFDPMGCDDTIFLRFLCETIHPAVRSSPDEANKLFDLYNEVLIRDGFELVEDRRLYGRPIYVGRYVGAIPGPDMGHVLEKPLIVDSTYVAQQIKRMQDSIQGDPELAIGTAKELMETVCKTILDERKEIYSKSADAPELVRQTAKVLKLTPDDISEKAKAADTIKRILGNLASIPQGIAELRNPYGTGHGKSARTKGLLPRHARLAVGAASTLVTFLIETHEEKPVGDKG